MRIAQRSIKPPLTLSAEAAPSGSGEALWVATVLTLRRYRDIRRVMNVSADVEEQLRKESGALGYALRVDILRRRFWTITVWTDEGALDRFLASAAHEVAKPLADELASPRSRAYARWREAASALVDWDAAERHLDAAAHGGGVSSSAEGAV